MNRLGEAAERSYRAGNDTVATICTGSRDFHKQCTCIYNVLASYLVKVLENQQFKIFVLVFLLITENNIDEEAY